MKYLLKSVDYNSTLCLNTQNVYSEPVFEIEITEDQYQILEFVSNIEKEGIGFDRIYVINGNRFKIEPKINME